MRSSLKFAVLAVALSAAPLAAQSSQAYVPLGVDSAHVTPDTVAAVPTSAPAPSITSLRAGAHKTESARPLQPTMATHANMGQGKALMIVGAAAFIAGALMDNGARDVFMVGGAVVGLIGLYQYLQ